jgi:hypothetical protein
MNLEERGRNRGPRVIVELIYGEEMRLVTNSDEEGSTATMGSRARRRAVLLVRRRG